MLSTHLLPPEAAHRAWQVGRLPLSHQLTGRGVAKVGGRGQPRPDYACQKGSQIELRRL